MRILLIELYKYKPLLHGGINLLKIDLSNSTNILTLILGCNGKGKSSVLRELTPYPATRTDYENGYKKIEIEHNGSYYSLMSNFSSNNQKAHSFIKDGINLNESGNTDVQLELCRHYFEFTDVIEKLTSGMYKICSMGKMDRRQLFLATYPSNLSFILEKHKKVCSKLRAFQTNHKSLKERQIDLSSKLIESSQLVNLRALKIRLEEVTDCLDREIFLISNTRNEYLQNEDYDCHSQLSLEDLQDLTVKLKTLYRQLISYFCRHQAEHHEQPSTAIKLLQQAIDSTTDQLQRVTSEAEHLSTEISQFKSIIDNDIAGEITKLKQLIVSYQTNLTNISLNPTIPIVSCEELEKIKTRLQPRLFSDMEILQPLAGKLWTFESVEKAKDWLENTRMRISRVNYEISVQRNEIKRLEDQYRIVTVKSYPASCRLQCVLKQDIDTIVGNNRKEYTAWSKEYEVSSAELTKLKRRQDKLENALQPSLSAMPILTKLEQLISGNSWGQFLTSHLPLISFLNNNSTQLCNNLTKLIQTNDNYFLKQKYTTELSICQSKLLALEATNLPAKTLIEKSIIEKEAKLVLLTNHHQQLKQEIQHKTIKITHHQELQSLIERYETLADETIKVSNQLYIQYQLDFLTMILSEKNGIKSNINTKLREIDQTLKEQDAILIRLNDEIIPSITTIESKIKRWAGIETQLSPVTGIPHVYTVRFINSLIKEINDYIRIVWSYDMELVYLEENEPLDFTIRVILNKSSELKDIAICSTGQQAIINLAMMLAICRIRQYAEKYPIKLDEIDAALSEHHRTNLVLLLVKMITDKTVLQMFMVDHHATLYSSMLNADIVALSENAGLLPPNYNECVEIK